MKGMNAIQKYVCQPAKTEPKFDFKSIFGTQDVWRKYKWIQHLTNKIQQEEKDYKCPKIPTAIK